VLRTLRAPRSLGEPQGDIAGYTTHGEGVYIHLLHGEAQIRFSPAPINAPMLKEANAKLVAWDRVGSGARLGLEGHVPIEFSLPGAVTCEVSFRGHRVTRGSDGRYRLPDTHAHGIDIGCT
jgi:hypothetical protein